MNHVAIVVYEKKCESRENLYLCTIIAGQYNYDDCFINCGKVTDIKIDKEE